MMGMPAMRSQKKNNRSPRPFKQPDNVWSGNRADRGFIPGAKPAAAKPRPTPPPPVAEPPAQNDA